MERKYSPPFMIQMVSGENNEHCDLFPHGSFHDVRKCEEGYLWKVGTRPYSIPDRFKTAVIPILTKEMLPLKECQTCNNLFKRDWPFSKTGDCIRCFERMYVKISGGDRDEYRELLRKELKGVG